MSNCVERADVHLRSMYLAHYGALLGFVNRLVLDDQPSAEDVVQETFLRAWQHADEVQPATAAPWLFTVARRVAISSHRRRQGRHEAFEVMTDDMAVGDEVESVLDNLVVATALDALTDLHRQVLRELYFEQRTVAETAEALGIPKGTVKSRSFYALRALRDALEQRGVHQP